MVEAARRLGPGFADGVRFVELAAVSAADLVAPAIAAGLGLSTSAGQLTADLQAYLRPRRLLLAVDNFEQVLTAAALLAGLLAAAPGLVVLATSRAVLRLSGEHEFAVPPLPIPPAGTALDPAGLLDYASVRLFTERAHAAAPDFQLTGDNAAAVAEICRRLDGLPLAIELAAARLRLLPPQALASRLGQRFSLLTGGPRDLPQRQQTLRNTLDWSFGLLSAAEQALFTRLGVFAGPFSLPAAEAIGADAPEEGHAPGAGELMDTLGSLVDSSLVRPQTRYGEPWFALLETIREYALDRLREGGEWTEAHDRHAAYFLALAEPAAADLAGPGQAGVAGPAGGRARQPVGRNVLAGGPRPAGAGRAPEPGGLEVLVAARPRRGAGPPRRRLRGRQRGPAVISARGGADPSRLHPHRQRRSGPGAAAAGADAAVVLPGEREAGRADERHRAGNPGPPGRDP
ncbi:MAG TPA: hypothetical protein VG123_06020, partial [Streptosporangiaceae bacterium]|nr:hypothetical protein [Streptosporangiaceae bacterium]